MTLQDSTNGFPQLLHGYIIRREYKSNTPLWFFLSLRNRRQLSPLSTQNLYPNYLMILYAKIAHQVIFESYVLKNSLLRTFLYVVQISFYHTRLQ